MPKVTALITVFNRRDLAREAVRSAVEQTERDIEVVVIDDGSTDGSADAIEAAFGDDPRLRIVRQANGGTAAARNRGLAEARAPWIAFLDDDDLWDANYLEGQLSVAAAHPHVDAVLCDARYLGSWDRREPSVFASRGWKPPISLDAMLDGAWGLPSALMVRTDIARGLGYSSEFKVSEDTDFLFRFHLAGRRLVVNPSLRASWRRHEGGDGQTGQKTRDRDGVAHDHLAILERYALLTTSSSNVRRQIARRRALLLVRAGRWRSARPHLWAWWRRRPSSTRAFRYLLVSLFRRDRRP